MTEETIDGKLDITELSTTIRRSAMLFVDESRRPQRRPLDFEVAQIKRKNTRSF